MKTMFQRLFNFYTSNTAFSQPLIPIAIGTTLKPLSQTSGLNLSLNPQPQTSASSLKPLSQTSGLNLNLRPKTSISNLNFSLLTSLFLLLTSLFVNNGWGQTCPTIPTAAGTHAVTFDVGNNCTFTIPAGVTSIKVQAWGGGGSGGKGTSSGPTGGGGGGGGNYVQKNSISVTGGSTSIVVRVGAVGNNSAGGDSEVDVAGSNVIDAGGGNKGGDAPTNGGGSAPTQNYTLWCSGGCDVSSYGGIGSCGYSSGAGGGGGEGGCSNGSNGRGQTSCGTGGGNQSTGYDGNGDGGSGGGSSAGVGSTPGGGGGGRGSSTSNGGNGGGGRVIITYTVAACTNPTITASSGGSRCGTGTVGISATASAGSIEWFTTSTGGTAVGSSASGATWTTPSISATTTYYAEAVNGSCRSASRTAVNATVNTAPSITTHPNTSGNSRCLGGTFPSSLEVAASGTPTPTFQWYSNSTQSNSGGTLISGATNSTHLPQTATTGNFYYYAIATNSCGTATSNASGNRQVVADPTLSAPSNQTICFGGSSSFTSNLSGGTGTQNPDWQYSANGSSGWATVVDGTPTNAVYTNTTTATLNVSGNIAAGTYHYRRVLAANVQGCDATSNSATLTVTALPTITASSGASRCGTGTLGISATASAGSIEWFNASSNGTSQGTSNSAASWTTPSISSTTNYYAEAVNGSCRSAARTEVTATVNSNPTAPTSVTPSATTICHGNSVNLNATSAGNTINWYTVETDGTAIQTGVTSATNHSVSPTANTTYYAEAQNGSGCKSSRVATGLVTVENPVSAVNTAIGTTLQTNDYVWVGQTNSTWSTANNWRQFNGTNLVAAASAPGSDNTNRIYLVQNSTSSNCIFNATSLSLGGALGVTSLFVGTGTSLNLNNQNLDLGGNITINGTFTPGSGTITLSGNTNQTLDGSSALSFSNVTINKSGGTLTAAKDMTITGTLTLTSGILDMNSKTLTMGTSSANGTITGGSASSYIVALDAATPSKLIHNVNSTSNTTYSFPIGTGSAYTPVTVVMKGGTLSNASIQVWTKNSKVTGINPNLSRNLNRSWYVIQSGITSPSYDIEYKYADVVGEITGSPTEDLVPFKLSDETWYAPTNSLVTNCTKIGSYSVNYTTRTLTWSGLNSFSEFGGGGGSNEPLPVELVSFSGSCEEGNVHLSWQTASEFNSSHFDVEKSRDGENWQVIETLPAAGNSHELLNYETFDQVSNALNYYRLNQVDIDGTNKRYDPIAVSCEASSNGIFITYPNPSNEGFNVLINDNELEGEMNMNIYTATGSRTLQKRIGVKDGINVFMMNEKLLPGVYFIEIKDQQNKTKVIKHMVN